MRGLSGSFEAPSNRPPSMTEVHTRPDGVTVVDLKTATDTMRFILRDGVPYITMTTGTGTFENLPEEDQEIVRKAFGLA